MSLEQMKANLLTKLASASKSPTYSGAIAVEFLQDFFYFATKCRQNSKTPCDLFVNDEKTTLVADLKNAIPKLDDEVFSKCNHWGCEHLRSFRTLRSGIEFLDYDVIQNEESLKSSWKAFLESDGMEELKEKLEMLAGDRAEYDDGKDPVDLRNVPEEHNWWSTLERNDSKAKFGL